MTTFTIPHPDTGELRTFRVAGDAPDTNTLGVRWNAFNNLFWTAADIAEDEWRAKYDPNEETAARSPKQFIWAIPADPGGVDLTGLDWRTVAKRAGELPRGVVPEDALCVTVGCDVGKRALHWVAVAMCPDAAPHVIAYEESDTGDLRDGEEHAVLRTLQAVLADVWDRGWPRHGTGELVKPAYVLVDSGYLDKSVYALARSAAAAPDRKGPRVLPVKGYGIGQRAGRYPAAGKAHKRGPGYHVTHLAAERTWLCHVDADHWKTWVHRRAATAAGHKGALSLHAGGPADHLTYGKHLTAETQREEWDSAKNAFVAVWRNEYGRANHYGDATVYACVAGDLAGVRQQLEQPEQTAKPASARRERKTLRRPDGRPFLVTER